jgi:hypothetical protein
MSFNVVFVADTAQNSAIAYQCIGTIAVAVL